MATHAVTDASFSDVSDEFEGRIKIAKMDIQENPDTPGKFHVRGIPTLMIFKEGQVVATKVGEMSKTKLSEWLAEHA